MPAPELLIQQDTKITKERFPKTKPLLTSSEAHLEASRCLFCFDAPCIKACPTSIDIPLFIRQIMTKDLKGSARTILSQNIFGRSCGDICPTSVLCEGACVYLNLNKKPVEIGRLQSYAANYAIENNIRFFQKGKNINKQIAVIGAGPAGLACAHELIIIGYDVVVYEANEKAGGLITYGVAPYKFTNDDAQKEVEYISKIGFKVKTGIKAVSESKNSSMYEISIKELEKNYDAIFIACGLGKSKRIKISGENLKGVYGSIEFIHELKDKEQVKIGKHVVVIGGGNTGMDAAVASSLLGSNVTVIYRRQEQDQSAYKFEIEHARKHNVKFMYLTSPVEILGKEIVSGIRCIKMKPKSCFSGEKTKIEKIAGSEFDILCDTVIVSTGQEKLLELFNAIPTLKLDEGKIIVNKDFQTSNPKYFAGGDCINGGNEVVHAVAHGRDAARGIHRYITSCKLQVTSSKEL